MSLLSRKILETKVELVLARKKTTKFREEATYNHAIYALNQVLSMLEKQAASAGAQGTQNGQS